MGRIHREKRLIAPLVIGAICVTLAASYLTREYWSKQVISVQKATDIAAPLAKNYCMKQVHIEGECDRLVVVSQDREHYNFIDGPDEYVGDYTIDFASRGLEGKVYVRVSLDLSGKVLYVNSGQSEYPNPKL